MSIQKKIRALWRPEMYHGWGKSTSYFEGWYLKMIDSTRSHAYAIIPGISLENAKEFSKTAADSSKNLCYLFQLFIVMGPNVQPF